MLTYIWMAIPTTAFGLWWMRRDYRSLGRLSWPCLAVVLVMFFIPHLALHDAIRYTVPTAAIAWVGVVLAALGVALCLGAFGVFGAVKKVLCLDHGTLTVTGPYRWTRNPQYVGWSMFVFGFALTGWTARCLIALGIYVVIVHGMVLVEEEHLGRVFGTDYGAFRRQVPRYVGLVRRGVP